MSCFGNTMRFRLKIGKRSWKLWHFLRCHFVKTKFCYWKFEVILHVCGHPQMYPKFIWMAATDLPQSTKFIEFAGKRNILRKYCSWNNENLRKKECLLSGREVCKKISNDLEYSTLFSYTRGVDLKISWV